MLSADFLKKSPKTTAPKDPQAKREAEKYERPIASRELILEVMAERDVPMHFNELATALGIQNDSDLLSLQKRIRAMQRDGQLITGRRGALGLPKKMDLVKCRIIGHRDGYGFASPIEGGDEDLPTLAELKRLEGEVIRRAWEACGRKVSGAGGAAEKLGLPPSTLASRLKALGFRRS